MGACLQSGVYVGPSKGCPVGSIIIQLSSSALMTNSLSYGLVLKGLYVEWSGSKWLSLPGHALLLVRSQAGCHEQRKLKRIYRKVPERNSDEIHPLGHAAGLYYKVS
jgi:hypothetical protein